MFNLFTGILLVAIACAFIVIKKTYLQLPAKELKRRASKNEPGYSDLFKAVAYDSSLQGLLWFLIIFFSAYGFVLITSHLPVLLSALLVGALVFISYVWLPNSRLSKFGQKLTILVNPAIVWLLGYLDPLIKKISAKTESWSHKEFHTGLFERQDLEEIIEKLQHQKDSRFSEEELELAKRALSFDDQSVKDVMVSRKQVKVISPDDLIGPVLVDELHKNGQIHAIVKSSAKGPIEGSINYTKLDLQRSGKIKDIMETTVYFVHQDDKLSEALRAFKITNHPLLIVVNSHQDYVGILTVDNILEQLLGHIPGDDFNQYADLMAVAGKHLKIHNSDEVAETSVKTDE